MWNASRTARTRPFPSSATARAWWCAVALAAAHVLSARTAWARCPEEGESRRVLTTPVATLGCEASTALLNRIKTWDSCPPETADEIDSLNIQLQRHLYQSCKQAPGLPVTPPDEFFDALIKDSRGLYWRVLHERQECERSPACQPHLQDYVDREFRAAVDQVALMLDLRKDLAEARKVVSESLRDRSEGPLRDVLADPVIARLLASYLEALRETGYAISPELYAELLRPKPDAARIGALLHEHPGDAALVRRRLQSLGNMKEQIDWWQSQASRTVLVVESQPPPTTACSGASTFLLGFNRLATRQGPIREPLVVSADRLDDVLAQAPCLCGKQTGCRPPARPLDSKTLEVLRDPCTAIVDVKVEERPPSASRPQLGALGSVRFVLPEGAAGGPNVSQREPRPFPSRPFATDCTEPLARQDELSAAADFFDDLVMRYEIVQDGAVREQRVLGAMAIPPTEAGVKVEPRERVTVGAEALHADAGLRVTGECRPDFAASMQRHLRDVPFLAASRGAREPSTLDLARAGDGGCTVSLRLPDTSLVPEARHGVVFVLDAHAEKEDLWENAGHVATTKVAAYWLDALTSERPGPTPPPSRPSPWSGLLLSGLPQLLGSGTDRTAGLVLAGTDVALTLGGVGTIVAGLVARNQAADSPGGSLDATNALLTVGFSLLGAVLVERGISVAVELLHSKEEPRP